MTTRPELSQRRVEASTQSEPRRPHRAEGDDCPGGMMKEGLGVPDDPQNTTFRTSLSTKTRFETEPEDRAVALLLQPGEATWRMALHYSRTAVWVNLHITCLSAVGSGAEGSGDLAASGHVWLHLFGQGKRR